MKNNFTPQLFPFSSNEQIQLSDLELRIVNSFRKERKMKAKKSTVRSILWYAAALDIKHTVSINDVEIVLN